MFYNVKVINQAGTVSQESWFREGSAGKAAVGCLNRFKRDTGDDGIAKVYAEKGGFVGAFKLLPCGWKAKRV